MEHYFYLIRHSWYEEDYQYFFFGPKVDNWEELCDSILNEAVDKAIECRKEDEEYPDVVDALAIYSAMIELLEPKGFYYVDIEQIPQFKNCGCTLIPDVYGEPSGLEKRISKSAINKIKEHTDWCEKKWDELK